MAKDYDDEIDLEQTGGFGKAAVAEAAKRPTYRSTEAQVDERDRRQEAQASMPKKKTFREAFAEARSAGKDTFTWNGKKYTTELAKPASSAPKAEPAKAEPAKDTPPSRPRISQARGSMKEKMREMGVTRYKSGGAVKSSASKRADGCAIRGKTKGKMK
jgi:hypothetical protein